MLMLTIYPKTDMGNLVSSRTWRDFNGNLVEETNDMVNWWYKSASYDKMFSAISVEYSPEGCAFYSTKPDQNDIYLVDNYNGMLLSVKINFKNIRSVPKGPE
jgi:hypothetical protein